MVMVDLASPFSHLAVRPTDALTQGIAYSQIRQHISSDNRGTTNHENSRQASIRGVKVQ
jgi:hypothetical protein